MKNKIAWYIVPSLLIGVLIGLLIPSPSSKSFKEIRNQQNYKFINPLLECEESNFSNDKNLNQLKSQINFLVDQQIESKQINFASVYYRDLNNGPWFGIREKEYFSPASLIKVPLLMAYYKLAEKQPEKLKEEIVNNLEFDPTAQNIEPQEILEINKNYTVDELLNRMIIYSDNNAYKLLITHIDNNLVFKVYEELGVDISKALNDPSGNIITVKDYASFFRILFNSSYLEKEYSEKALELLSKSVYNDGLVKDLPPNTVVAHKFGERHYNQTNEYQLHDCGIIYSPKKPYLLCIMTRGQSFAPLSRVINQISKTIYDNISP